MSLRHLFLGALLCACMPMAARAQAAASPDATRQAYRVLLVGDSLIYVNNLPAMLRAVGASQHVAIATETYAAPGGTLSERWDDGQAAEALRTRAFDVVVLQESNRLAACAGNAVERRKAPCASSQRAFAHFAKLAGERGAKTLVVANWGRDDKAQRQLGRGGRETATAIGAGVFGGGRIIHALQTAKPGVRVLPDGAHPNPEASVMLALGLYRDIAGSAPVATELAIGAPLLPPNAAVSPATALETQAALAGNGSVTVIPADLVAPLLPLLPDPRDKDADRRGRGR